MSLNIGSIYKRILIVILVIFFAIIMICTFTKYKLCRFPFDVIYAPSQSLSESEKLGVFQARYVPLNNKIRFESTHVQIESIWIERLWYSNSYTNEVNSESLKDSTNLIVIKMKDINQIEFRQNKYSLTIFNDNQIFSGSDSFNSLNQVLTCRTLQLPDTLKLIVHEAFRPLKGIRKFETLLIKK